MSFLQKSAIFISNCRVSHKTVNCDDYKGAETSNWCHFEEQTLL